MSMSLEGGFVDEPTYSVDAASSEEICKKIISFFGFYIRYGHYLDHQIVITSYTKVDANQVLQDVIKYPKTELIINNMVCGLCHKYSDQIQVQVKTYQSDHGLTIGQTCDAIYRGIKKSVAEFAVRHVVDPTVAKSMIQAFVYWIITETFQKGQALSLTVKGYPWHQEIFGQIKTGADMGAARCHPLDLATTEKGLAGAIAGAKV